MFQRTLTKLTVLYLTIIMTVSLAFSISLYQVSIGELDRGLRNQSEMFLERPRIKTIFDDPTIIINSREYTFTQSRNRMIANLVIVNLIILLGGGFLSYYLAKRSLKPIQEAHEAQSRFTADASHELRTPLAAMQTEIEVSLMDPKLTLAQAKDQLKSNLEELAKLTYLSEGLLKLARLENKDLDLKQTSFDSIVTNSIQFVSKRAEEKFITLDYQKPKEKINILADASSLQEAISAILDNAVKYSPSKSPVRIEVSKDHKFGKVSIVDQGQGINPKDIEHIFERFYRADNARCKENCGGYGIGLSIAKNIVDLHNGHIKVTSQLNKGSQFQVLIPLSS